MSQPVPAHLADAEPDAPRPDKMEEVRQLAQELVLKQQQMAHMTEQLSSLSAEVLELSQRKIPDAMAEAGTDSVGLPDLNVDVRLKDWVRAVLPKDLSLRSQGIDWLVENGASDIVKCDVGVSFSRGEHNEAIDLAETLRERFPGHGVDVREDVHHMTLTAFIRSKLADGVPVPMDALGATTGRVAQIKERS